jgi:hypothetical protein
MIMIDPVTAYLGGKVDSHRTTDVRSILEPLDKFAERHKCAVVCITHPPKAAQSKAINSFTGSLAFVAAARVAFVAIDDPEDPLADRQMLLPVKNNIGPMAPGLAYRRIGCVTEKGFRQRMLFGTRSPCLPTTRYGRAKAARAEGLLGERLKSFSRSSLPMVRSWPAPLRKLPMTSEYPSER